MSDFVSFSSSSSVQVEDEVTFMERMAKKERLAPTTEGATSYAREPEVVVIGLDPSPSRRLPSST